MAYEMMRRWACDLRFCQGWGSLSVHAGSVFYLGDEFESKSFGDQRITQHVICGSVSSKPTHISHHILNVILTYTKLIVCVHTKSSGQLGLWLNQILEVFCSSKRGKGQGLGDREMGNANSKLSATSESLRYLPKKWLVY
jgi:hypothetical protein